MVWSCDFAVNAVGKLTGTLLDRIFMKLIVNPIALVLNCNKNVQELNDNLATLAGKRQSIQHDVDEAKRRAEEIELEVTNWMAKADEYVTAEAKRLRGQLEEKAMKRCFMGLCLNPVARFKLSKKAEEDASVVDQLVGEPSQFRRISYFLNDQREEVAAADDGLQHFDSRNKVLKEIMDSLKEPGVKRIGLHGMPGVGKTTLAKEVKRRSRKEKLFHAVVLATVTRTPDLKRIQAEIAHDLNLVLPNGNEEWEAADRIKAKLREKKNVLVILDDVWARLELKEIGIQLENTESKILLTSRNRDVLSRELCSDKNIKVGQLQDEEAWKLFEEIVGADVERFDLQQIAIQIVKKCGGLPLAIVTLGNALKGRESHAWCDALEQLRNPSAENFEGVSNEVYAAIEFSYNHLRDGLKKTFLLCSFLSHADGDIDLLVRYAAGLHLFPNISTIKATRHKVLTHVSMLKDAALLIDVNSNLKFGINDVVRDVAMAIAARDNCGLLLEDGKQLDMEALTKFSWIFFVGQPADIIADLPNDMEFPQLALFHGEDPDSDLLDDEIIEIPTSLFKRMQKLKVLNVSIRWVADACLSLSFLTNLRSLTIWDAGDVTGLGELKNLEVLCISGYQIKELPSEVGKLTRLKVLDLRPCVNLKVISPNIIANLSRLEELYFDRVRSWFGCIQWDLAENGEQRNASLTELSHLHSLTILHISIHDVRILPPDSIDLFSRLESFKIFIGNLCSGRPDEFFDDYLRTLELEMNEGSCFDRSIGRLLKRTEVLHLSKIKGIKNVVHELDAEGFQELKLLHVENALDVQHIVNSVGRVGSNAFPILDTLILLRMHNLERINHGSLRATSFSKLKVVYVGDCHRIKILFYLSMVRQLRQLRKISVVDCEKMVGIVDEDGQGDSNNEIVEATDQEVEFGQLRSLSLSHVPEFISFRYGKKSSLIDEDKQNQLTNDPSSRPIPLFDKKVVFPSLEELELRWIEIKMICHISVMPHCIMNLTKLTVMCCDNLELLFSSSMARGLEKLRHLEIKDCKNIREIFATEGVEDMEDLISFPRLNSLVMEDLQNLVRFYWGNCVIEFSSLMELTINNCPKLKELVSTGIDGMADRHHLFNKQVLFPNLQKLELRIVEIKMIGHISATAHCITNLTKLTIEGCGNLELLFSSSVARGLEKLRHLKIQECKNIREIIATENVEGMEDLISFPQLNFLEIKDLQNLVRFYSGNCMIEFPSLKQLAIENCPKLKGLTVKSTSIDAMAEGHHLFNKQVVFPNLEGLEVKGIQKITTIRHMTHCCIPNLAKLTIDGCHNLVRLFSSSIAIGLVNLRDLKINNCKNIKEIMVTENAEDMEGLVSFSQLSFLEIKDLPNLVGFYLGNYIVEFPSLKQLQIPNCPKFKMFTIKSRSTIAVANIHPFFNEQVKFPVLERLALISVGTEFLFTSSVVKSFEQLKVLSIINCRMMKGVIVAEEESTCKVLTMLFPKLVELEFVWLPELTTFFMEFTSNCSSREQISESQVLPATQSTLVETVTSKNVFPRSCNQTHVKEFPSLRIIKVERCSKVQIFASEFPIFERMQGDNQLESQIKHPMFWVNQATFQSLERLQLHGNYNMNEIWCGQYAERFFHRLKVLELIDSTKQLAVLPSFFYQVPNNIEEPSLGCASFGEIFRCEGLRCKEKPTNASTQLSDLRISQLQELVVVKFGKIKDLVPSFISFQNLQNLRVNYCHRLTNLLRYSTAKSLVSLRKMSISNCSMVEEIIACLDDDVNDGIVFSQLKCLHLRNLPRLSSFCSVECNFKFPSLNDIVVVGCSNMQIFSKGELSAPKLQQVQVREDHPLFHGLSLYDCDKWRWDDNLNTTIQQLFAEKNPPEAYENMIPDSILGINEEV